MKTIAATVVALGVFAGAWLGVDARLLAPPGQCQDIYEVAAHFGTYKGQAREAIPRYHPRYDLNNDGAVTVGDIVLAIRCNTE